jgi:predicted signal transduction protein with EAL and GGDEF domain
LFESEFIRRSLPYCNISASAEGGLHPIPGAVNDEEIITLGQSLHLTVIAEGVETESQRQFLAKLGCDEMQGFLRSRAIPAAEFF